MPSSHYTDCAFKGPCLSPVHCMCLYSNAWKHDHWAGRCLFHLNAIKSPFSKPDSWRGHGFDAMEGLRCELGIIIDGRNDDGNLFLSHSPPIHNRLLMQCINGYCTINICCRGCGKHKYWWYHAACLCMIDCGIKACGLQTIVLECTM